MSPINVGPKICIKYSKHWRSCFSSSIDCECPFWLASSMQNCENIGWRCINYRSDATRQYISAKNALFKSFLQCKIGLFLKSYFSVNNFLARTLTCAETLILHLFCTWKHKKKFDTLEKLQKFSVLPKMARFSQKVENSNNFFNIFYTWNKSFCWPLQWKFMTKVDRKISVKVSLVSDCCPWIRPKIMYI